MVMDMTESLVRILNYLMNSCCLAQSVSAGTRPQCILSGVPIHNQKDLICLLMVSPEDDGDTKAE